MKKFRKEITHAIRDLDRINRKREMETVTLRADMAKSLKMNNEAVVRIKAKTLVNHKKSITRMLTLRSQMQALEGMLAESVANSAMVSTLQKTANTMKSMMAGTNLADVSATLQDFSVGMDQMMQMQGMVAEQLDDVWQDGNEEADMNKEINAIIMEEKAKMGNVTVGGAMLGSAGVGAVAAPSAQPVGADARSGASSSTAGPRPPTGGSGGAPGTGGGGGGGGGGAGGVPPPSTLGGGGGGGISQSTAERIANLKK